MKHIGNSIKETIKRKKLRRKDLANFLNVSEAHISNIYANKTLNIDMLQKICDFMGEDVSTFLQEPTQYANGDNNIQANGNFFNSSVAEQRSDYENNNKELVKLREIAEVRQREIELMKELLKAKDEIIENLKRQLRQ